LPQKQATVQNSAALPAHPAELPTTTSQSAQTTQ
jgi:hypothetical protein